MADLSGARALPTIVPSPARLLPLAARYSLRGQPPVLAAAVQALGLSYTDKAACSASHEGRAALWMGPDEQLLLAPAAAATEIEELLGTALSGMAYSLVDISHRQVALEISGPQAEALLAVAARWISISRPFRSAWPRAR